MGEMVAEYILKDKILRIFQDIYTESPRDWDNVGKMLCFHNRYNLGDKTNLNSDDFDSWDEVEEYLIKEEQAKIIMPLYLYDHSGLRMKIGSFNGLLPQGHAGFDSGMVGFIYATREDILQNFSKKKLSKDMLKRTKEILIHEVKLYDQYLSGDVYGYKLIETQKCNLGHIHENITDSCWGFYGTDFKTNGLLESSGVSIEEFSNITGN